MEEVKATTAFQSTLPLRGVTVLVCHLCGGGGISIHTPLAGSDPAGKQDGAAVTRFQSTLPLRGVTQTASRMSASGTFQSTLPLRGVTPYAGQLRHRVPISIHTPLAGSDQLPGGTGHSAWISIHTPLAGSDQVAAQESNGMLEFQSTLPLRGVTSGMGEILGI